MLIFSAICMQEFKLHILIYSFLSKCYHLSSQIKSSCSLVWAQRRWCHLTHEQPTNTWVPSKWRHNKRHGVSNHRRLHCLLNCWYKPSSEKTSKFCVTGLCAGNSPVTSEFPTQKASNVENVSIWWCHHAFSAVWIPMAWCFRTRASVASVLTRYWWYHTKYFIYSKQHQHMKLHFAKYDPVAYGLTMINIR